MPECGTLANDRNDQYTLIQVTSQTMDVRETHSAGVCIREIKRQETGMDIEVEIVTMSKRV